MKYANSAARLVRRAMLTKDEDGEKVHRFQREWDGSDTNIRWARYDADHDQSIWTARTWTSWGLGVEASYTEDYHWDSHLTRQMSWDHWAAILRFGPYWVGLQWHYKQRPTA